MKRLIILISFVFIPFYFLFAQHDPSGALPLDPSVRVGRLENGLVYYLRHNTMPPNRMEMRLVVNAGSILEDEEQQGLAHFVEHMAFNGTRDFSKGALVDFLEKVGVRFGADLNAYTSFDETVYMLQLPTDRQGLIDTAFMVLENWAHLLSFDGEEIEKERGVIREEWRLGLGADDRMRKEYFPVILKGSRYAERLPIGTLGVIDTAAHQSLRNFYKDWYRPDLQAVIVVGDMDMNLAEQKIKEHFAHIQNPADKRKREQFGVPDNNEPLIAIATDKEATSTSLSLMYKHPKEETKTYADYRRNITHGLYSGMIINRLQEFNKKPESPFIYAYTYYGGFMGRAVNAYSSSAGVKENRVQDAIAALIQENERVKQHGFTQPELERQKLQLITRLEKQQKEQDKTNSSSFVRHYINHFLQEAPFLAIDQELEITKEMLEDIQLEEINALAHKWITDKNMLVVITAPEREEVVLPDADEVMRIITVAKSENLEPWIDTFVDHPLFDKKLREADIIHQSTDTEIGIEEFQLDNGIRVVIKPTDFKNDEILLTAFGSGGTSVFDDNQVVATAFMTRAVDASGIGDFSSTDLKKKLTGKVVNVQPFAEELRQGFRGNSSPDDFETMLQLISLYFEGARKDQEAFDAFHSQLMNQYKFLRSNPRAIFGDTLVKLSTQNSKRAILIPTDEQLASLNANEIYEMFNILFASAGGYTFIFTGNIDVDKMLPLIRNYLGSLPVEKPVLRWVNHDTKLPDGITDVSIHVGMEPQSQIAVLFQHPFEWTGNERLHLSMLMKAYNIKLRENMREELGGVYGVGARAVTQQYPEPQLDISISWSTNPAMVDTLSAIVFQQMRQLIENGPTTEDLTKVKETSVRERETNDRQNYFWSSYLDQQIYNNNILQNYESYRKAVEAVTIEDLKKIAQKYFHPDHYLRLVSYPEDIE
ncbi:MAG: insulinase family protein [Bacteroidales bacterium]|jgi:zinc protease|nr:insulinase family protein [Bacteroidales bacterium]MDY0370624.1 insulinase family protein [Bacteroidales bacterium]